ncbi:MAG: hypothetical protein ACYTF0_03645, partial [Planctomycetota bacterium]
TAGITAPVGALSVRVEFGADAGELLSGYIAKLDKALAAKEKAAAGKRGRLSNAKYVTGAPADKVQETRDMLAQDEAEIAKIQTTLSELRG